MWYTFDIETAPLPADQLEALLPPFDAAEVKCGNLKDPEKIAAKLAEAEASHRRQFADNAALDPLTGRVLVVGHYDVKNDAFVLMEGDEPDVLKQFWDISSKLRFRDCHQAGVNILGFDLPFMVRRSWMLGVPVPHWVVVVSAQWPRWHPMFVDLRLTWQMGDRQARSSFDHIGRCLGTGGKCEGDHGANYANLWETDRETAIKYLRNDCEQPARWLKVMGLLSTE